MTMRPTQRLLAAATLASTLTAFAMPAAAQDAEACVSLHTSGQDLKEKGKWVQARESFVKCALDSCPNVVREECGKLLSTLDASIPSVVFQARDTKGQPTSAVEVRLEGKVFLKELKPTAVPLDPGQHRFSFRAADGSEVEKTITAVEGQKNQLVGIDFKPKPQPKPTPVRRKKVSEESAEASPWVPTCWAALP